MSCLVDGKLVNDTIRCYACMGNFWSDSTDTGNWKPISTPFAISVWKILGLSLADLCFPLEMAWFRSASLLELLIWSRGYLAPLLKIEETSFQNGLLSSKICRYLTGLIQSHNSDGNLCVR